MAVDVRVTTSSLSSVNRALQQVDKDLKREISVELHSIGALVQHDVESLALSTIPNMTMPWSQMRVGQTPFLIYVVPRQKGVRGKGPRRRPRFAELMLRRAMRPALARKKPEVDARFQKVVSVVCGKFSAGG